MTLEEAIKVCEDNAAKIGGNPQSDHHASCYKQAAEWLAQLKEAEWIDIKDCLPDINKYVLIYYPYWTGNEIQVAQLCYDKLTFDICGEFNVGVNKVTHWRSLPKPPMQ